MKGGNETRKMKKKLDRGRVIRGGGKMRMRKKGEYALVNPRSCR